MQHFGTAEVSRLTEIPARAIRAMVRARYVSPQRGARGALRFSFQDLVLLRTARALLASQVPPRRIGAALRAVRAQLPHHLPAQSLTVSTEGNRIVVHEAGRRRDAHSGQLLLALEVQRGQAVRVIEATPDPGAGGTPPDECAVQFEAALALEDSDPQSAVEAYRRCVQRHGHPGALANLGRLLHLSGRITEAVQLYREMQEPDADILFNLGVGLEDLGESDEAIDAYRRAIALDDAFADAHHNIARLYQHKGERHLALRHWNAYRRLERA